MHRVLCGGTEGPDRNLKDLDRATEYLRNGLKFALLCTSWKKGCLPLHDLEDLVSEGFTIILKNCCEEGPFYGTSFNKVGL
jgi:hypothetical protein